MNTPSPNEVMLTRGRALQFFTHQKLLPECPSPAIDPALLAAVHQLREGIEVEESFRLITSKLSRRLFGYFRAKNFSPEDAEDLVQKTLTRVYTGIGGLNREESFLGWLFTIARNLQLTALEEQRRQRGLVVGGIEVVKGLPDPQDTGWSHEVYEQQELVNKLRQEVDRLPAQQRQCLLLRVRDDMSYLEIAETLRLSVNTVRNHLAEARKSLQREFRTDSKR